MIRVRPTLVAVVLAITSAVAIAAPALAALVNVSVGSYFYEDATVGDGQVVINAGDQLKFTFVDGGKGTPHTVEIDELGIHSGAVGTGNTFTTGAITQPGTYVLYCKPHRNRGHETTLVVLAVEPTTTTTQATTTTTTTQATTTTTTGGTTTTIASTTTTTGGTTTTTLAGSPTTTVATTATTTGSSPGSGDPSTTTSPTEPNGSVPSPATGTVVEIEHDHSNHDHSDDTSAETTLAPTGIAGASDSLSALPLPPGIAILPAEPWTRSVRFGLLMALPLVVLAGGAGYRHVRRNGSRAT